MSKEWIVYGTALVGRMILVECPETEEYGFVRNPTDAEWARAFYAPSNPYR